MCRCFSVQTAIGSEKTTDYDTQYSSEYVYPGESYEPIGSEDKDAK
jgi:hypothetical protein